VGVAPWVERVWVGEDGGVALDVDCAGADLRVEGSVRPVWRVRGVLMMRLSATVYVNVSILLNSMVFLETSNVLSMGEFICWDLHMIDSSFIVLSNVALTHVPLSSRQFSTSSRSSVR
jgi:hypothetical protein